LNSGNFLFMARDLLLVHVSRADRPQEPPPLLRTPGEDHEQAAIGRSGADRAKPPFCGGVR
jgi:hypothetical protein